MTTVELKDWKIVQNELGDGTAVIQVFKGNKVRQAFVQDAMTKAKLKAYLQKKIKDENSSM